MEGDNSKTLNFLNDMIANYSNTKEFELERGEISLEEGDYETLAIGGGQTSRVWALENAIHNNQDKNFEGAVLASDAFFPFNDCVKVAADAGISAIIQPGGSIKDQDSIDLCNELNIPMVFSGYRHFRH